MVGQRGQAGGDVAGMAETGQVVQGAGGADEVADLFAEVGRGFELVAGGGEVAGGGCGPGPGLEELGLGKQVRGHAEGIERGERLGRTVGLSGQRQCVSGGDVGPPGGVGAPELLEERVGLAGPARGAHQAALFEVQDGETIR